MNKLIIVFLSSFLFSCSHYSPIYWGWGEWVGSDVAATGKRSIASFDWSSLPGVITAIDGNSVGDGYKKAKLAPGRHLVEYAYYPAEFGVHPQGRIEIDLTAGHSYELGLRLCFWCKPRKYAIWVDDTTTGQVVWGKRPDWPFWYL